MRHLDDVERRTRLARRHAVSPAHRAADPLAATRAMTVLHATEPATVHLSLHARVDGLRVADVDRVLYDERTVVKQLAMRRTLFVLPARAAAGGLGQCAAPASRPSCGPGWPRRSRPAASPTTERPGSTRRARRCWPSSPTGARPPPRRSGRHCPS